MLVLFDLYIETRKFVRMLIDKCSQDERERLRTTDFSDRFEPFVIRWIRSSQQNAKMWVENAISADEWIPITSEDMYSTSVLDTCRGLQEILDLYRRLEWPDFQTAAQVFTPAVLNIVSDVATNYAAQVGAFFLDKSRTKSTCLSSRPGGGSSIVDIYLSCALNNLDEMEVKADQMFSYIRIDVRRL